MCGGGSAPPPPAPTMADATQTRQATDARRRQQSMQQGTAGSVRNVGGARGLSISDTQRALKSLTGQ